MAERILTTEEVERIRNDKRPITRESMADVFETLETLRAERDRLVQTVIEYLDNRPDDELGTKQHWDKFYPIARKLEQMLGVEDGRWG